MQRLGRGFEWMDALEFAIPAILAAVLFVAGPIALVVHFLWAHDYGPAVGGTALWVFAVICCVRDFRRRKFSAFTGILLAGWFVATVVIWWKLEAP